MSRPQNDNRPSRPRRRLNWRGWLQVAVGVGALAFLIVKSDARGLLEAIKTTQVSLLPVAVLATVCVNWLMAYRWGVVLMTGGYRVKTRRLFVYYLIGIFFMNFVPGGGVSGDVARLIYAGREIGDKPFVLSSLIYERMVGLFTLLSLGLGATVLGRGQFLEGRGFYVSEALLAVTLVGFAALMSEWISSRLARLALSAGRRFKLQRPAEAAARTLGAISDLRKHRQMLIMTVLLSVMIRIVWGLGCFVVARAMRLPVSFAVLFSFISLVDMIRMLPTWGGGIGVREWALVVLFAGVGIGREQALMFSFLAFAPVLMNAVLGGVLYTSGAGRLKKESRLINHSTVEIGR